MTRRTGSTIPASVRATRHSTVAACSLRQDRLAYTEAAKLCPAGSSPAVEYPHSLAPKPRGNGGSAVARAFARRGWRLGLVARGGDGLEAVRREVGAAGAPRALEFAAGMADAAAAFAAADRVASELGGIEAWVNNAMAAVFAPASEITLSGFRRVADVTHLGHVHGATTALRHMRPRGGGTIVQVGSALAHRAIPAHAGQRPVGLPRGSSMNTAFSLNGARVGVGRGR